jgi:hypothetical protein
MNYETIHNNGQVVENGTEMINQCLWISIRDYLRYCRNEEFSIIQIKEMAGLGPESDYIMADWENPLFRHAIERIAEILNIRLEFYPVYLNDNIVEARHIMNEHADEVVPIAFYGAHFEYIVSGPNIIQCRMGPKMGSIDKQNIGAFKPDLTVINPQLDESTKEEFISIYKEIQDNINRIELIKQNIDRNNIKKNDLKTAGYKIVERVERLQYSGLDDISKDAILQHYSKEFNILKNKRDKLNMDNEKLQSEINKLIAQNEDLLYVIDALTPDVGSKQSISASPNILVYCHPRKINYNDKSSHWWLSNTYADISRKPIMDYILEHNNIKPTSAKFNTVDIHGTPDYITDGFSSEFISQHQNEFDIVLLPDCGGIWHDISLIRDNEDASIMLYTLIESILTIVKKNGYLYLSKLIFPEKVLNDVIFNLKQQYTVNRLGRDMNMIEIIKH